MGPIAFFANPELFSTFTIFITNMIGLIGLCLAITWRNPWVLCAFALIWLIFGIVSYGIQAVG